MTTGALFCKKVFAQAALASTRCKVMSKAAFVDLCMHSTQTPVEHRMTREESERFLKSLCNAAQIIAISNDTVFLSPRDVTDAVHTEAGLPCLSRGLPLLVRQQSALTACVEKADECAKASVCKAVGEQRTFWAAMALLSGAQMTVLAYLTFQVYGWDVMEPVCFFVTAVTGLCSFAYFLRFRTESTFENVNDELLPRVLAKELQFTQADLQKWVTDLRTSGELDAILAAYPETSSQLLDRVTQS